MFVYPKISQKPIFLDQSFQVLEEILQMLDKEDLELLLHEIVKNKKLFIVLDDVWDAQVWGEVIVQTLAGCFT